MYERVVTNPYAVVVCKGTSLSAMFQGRLSAVCLLVLQRKRPLLIHFLACTSQSVLTLLLCNCYTYLNLGSIPFLAWYKFKACVHCFEFLLRQRRNLCRICRMISREALAYIIVSKFDIHETPPTVDCNDIMIKYWRYTHGPLKHQNKFP